MILRVRDNFERKVRERGGKINHKVGFNFDTKTRLNWMHLPTTNSKYISGTVLLQKQKKKERKKVVLSLSAF